MSFWYASRAFGMYIQFLAVSFTTIAIFMIISINNDSDSLVSSTGQSIVYCIIISDSIQWGLRQLVSTQVAMSSIKRNFNII